MPANINPQKQRGYNLSIKFSSHFQALSILTFDFISDTLDYSVLKP